MFNVETFDSLVSASFRFTGACIPVRRVRCNMEIPALLALCQGLEGRFRDTGFDQNAVRDSGKAKHFNGIRDFATQLTICLVKVQNIYRMGQSLQ